MLNLIAITIATNDMAEYSNILLIGQNMLMLLENILSH
jgi:hypothetical protein